MDEKLFVIAIGGTGMRCLESFVHMCAIGMFDGKEINVLTLDTDYSNGNKGRVETLISYYNNIKEFPNDNANVNTFFSAKIKLFRFFNSYDKSERKTFNDLSSLQKNSNGQDNKDLTDLFIDDSVKKFNLEHGFRAQTHLGSMLMYHGIVEAMKKYVENREANREYKDLYSFVMELANNPNARVFVFGSIFGGTGASSIPIIPKALKEAASLDGTITLDLDNVKFASTLLTQYFSFTAPDKKQKDREHVIASSDNFAINSQAALQFYQQDPTVNKYYKRLYHIGWPENKKLSITTTGETVTGGENQKNDCHIVELLAACAAYDFFNMPVDQLNNERTAYLYRSVEDKDGAYLFTGQSFIDGSGGDMLAEKLGMFFSFAHIVLSRNGAAIKDNINGTKALKVFFNTRNIHDYDDLTDSQLEFVDKYLKYFAYDMDKDGILKSGWLYQLHDSIGSGSFIFKNDAFTRERKRLENIDSGDLFFDEKHAWKCNAITLDKPRSRYSIWCDLIASDNDCRADEQAQNVRTVMEKFIAHIYKGIAKSQHYEAK